MKVMINREVIVRIQCTKCRSVISSEHELISPDAHEKNYRCKNCDGETFNVVDNWQRD